MFLSFFKSACKDPKIPVQLKQKTLDKSEKVCYNFLCMYAYCINFNNYLLIFLNNVCLFLKLKNI